MCGKGKGREGKEEGKEERGVKGEGKRGGGGGRRGKKGGGGLRRRETVGVEKERRRNVGGRGVKRKILNGLYEETYFWKACCVAADPLVKHRAFCFLRPHGHASVMRVLQGVSGQGCP